MHDQSFSLQLTIRCAGVEALRAVLSYEATEYCETEEHEQDEADPDVSGEWDAPHRDAMAAAWVGGFLGGSALLPTSSPSASSSSSSARPGRSGGHSFATSTALVLPVTRRGDGEFVCDVASACRDQAKTLPTMIARRTPATGADETADAGFGIVSTKVGSSAPMPASLPSHSRTASFPSLTHHSAATDLPTGLRHIHTRDGHRDQGNHVLTRTFEPLYLHDFTRFSWLY